MEPDKRRTHDPNELPDAPLGTSGHDRVGEANGRHHPQEMRGRAQQLQAIGLLAAEVAHDLNNILTPIQLSVSVLRERLSHPDDIELLGAVQNAVTRGIAVVSQIRGLVHRMDREPRVMKPQPILRELAEFIRETFPRSISLEQDIPADLWSVMANPTQVHRMLLNLCINARDAMPEGGRLRLGSRNCVLDETAAARIAGARTGRWVVIFVEDTGTGIASEILPHIWEPFFTTKSGQQGSGLGLPIVQEIVEAHAGFVAVDTAVGRGTVFQVFLPATESSAPEQPRPEPSPAADVPAFRQ